jgi:PAS domain S-box-containing protein
VEYMSQPTILIVEDEMIVAKNTRARLERLGYSVPGIALTMEEAVALAKKSSPDLVLMDIKLSGPGDGVEAAEIIQGELGIPVIFITAHTDRDTLDRAIVTEPFGYVHKPVDINELRSAIEMGIYRFRAESELRERITHERTIYMISSDLINRGIDELDEGIDNALQSLGTQAGGDRCYLFQIDAEHRTLSNTHEWCAEGVEPQIGNLKDLTYEDFPWIIPKILRSEIIDISNLSQLPQEAKNILGECVREGIQSLLIVPITIKGTVRGFMGMDSVRAEKIWNEPTIDLLRLGGEIIEGFLQRKKVDEALRESEERFRDLLDSLPNVAVMGYDRGGQVRFWNQASEELFGYTKEESLGKEITGLIHTEETRDRARERIIERSMRSGHPVPSEQEFVRKDGTRVPVYTSSFMVKKEEDPKTELFSVGIDLTPYKRAQQALQASETRFRNLTESLNVGIFRNTPGIAGRFLEANPALIRMFGYEGREEFLRLKVRDLYAQPEQRREFSEKLNANGSVKDEEIVLRKKDGTDFVGSISAIATRDPQGKVRYFDGLIEDISARKQAETGLSESLSMLEATIESTVDGILVVDGKGSMVKYNQRFLDMWGIPKEILTSPEEEPILATVIDQLSDPEGFLKKVIELYDTPERESLDILEFKDGRIFERYSQPQRIGDEIIGRVWSFTDVTDKATAKRNLELEKAYFEELFTNSPEAVILAENNGTVRRINKEFSKLFGYSNDEAVGKHVDDLITPMEHRGDARTITEETVSGGIAQLETIRHRKNGTEVPVSIIGSPITLGKEQVGVYAIYRDISDRIQASREQDRLNEQLAEKNQELQQVVYVTSHDLRSPLVNIHGFSQEIGKSISILKDILDRMDLPDGDREVIEIMMNEDLPEALGYIDTSVQKMDSLVKGLLRISKLGTEAIDPVEIDMQDLITDVVRNVEFRINEKGANIEIGDLPDCVGDKDQVNQVFSNIVDNALKYLDPERPGRISISGCIDGKFSKYSISDNGIGIPEDHVDKVFQIFHRVARTTISGEGLGLTAVKRILDRNHGMITLESETGTGSTFHIMLPTQTPGS